MDFEESIEDGLQSQSLEQVDSCSSSILESDEEDDGINVTIKEIVPGGSASQKLAGAARRKIKKMVVDGIDAEVAHAQVVSSTPKRNRDAALESPNGSVEIKPVPKKVCDSATSSEVAPTEAGDKSGSGQHGSGSVPQKKEENVVADQVTSAKKEVGVQGEGGLPGSTVDENKPGSTVDENKPEKKKKKNKKKKGDDAKKNDGAGAGGTSTGAGAAGSSADAEAGAANTGAGAGTGTGTGTGAGAVAGAASTGAGEVAGRGGKQKAGEAEGGRSNKKIRRDNFPAPTYEQIVSRTKLGILPAGYPDAELTPEQQEVVKDELLKKVLDQRREQFKPKFVYCKAKAGLVMLLCQEKGTADWVKLTVPTMIPWENAQLIALNEANIPRRDVLRAFFYRSKNDENDTILGYLESQNDNLDTSAWKILRRSVKVNDHVAWLFTVDLASMQLLEERNFVVNYKFGQTMFRRKQSDNEIHPADDDSDEDMDKDIFDEGLSSDVLAHGSVSSRPSGNGTTDGKLNN
ncbi:conserved hypothetical protein [Culex quinquefasciatus]|uniref:DUF4780 domain-containing protein n=1 Tax=Culex quinquefasciatus TaxID=7176 RepID=B0X4J9_CULQU|nr:conserved hypothetical protein [Culex quinquefasciatus]|eukprot:XP_001864571.1 conserved hypothetical protein [Culex quinquefasciatus]